MRGAYPVRRRPKGGRAGAANHAVSPLRFAARTRSHGRMRSSPRPPRPFLRGIAALTSLAALALSGALPAVTLAACGGSGGTGGGTLPQDAGDDTSGGAADAGDASGDDGGFVLDGTPEAGPLGCSADLRDVVDGAGKVVATCPVDKGCSVGVCVEACAAAEASRGNVGCDFRMPTPPSYVADLPPCFAAFIANTWPKPAKLSVERAGTTYDVTKFARIPEAGKAPTMWATVPATGIPVDGVAVLFLSHDPAAVFTETGKPLTCPVAPAIAASTVLPGSGKGEAFHITSDVPVSGYDILPYGGAESHFPSAELLFPTSAWGTNYVVMASPVGTLSPPEPLFTQLVAAQDNTTVQILPTVDLPAGAGFAAAPKAKTASFTLNAGQYLQWELSSATPDTSGSIVLSDKPVAVFAGNRLLRLQPTPAPGGDSTHQQIQPVSALANEYVAAPFATRRKDLAEEPIRYRVVGAFDGTMLTYDPPVTGAPTTLAHAQVVDFTATGAFRVVSQDGAHSFAIAQMMETANLSGGSRPGATAPSYPPNLGDEEFVIMLPPAQFLSKYVFFTDPTYPTTNLVLTRVKAKGAFQDVTVDCLGVIPASAWKDVGGGGAYQITNVDLVRADVGVGTCTNGRHLATSAGPFGVVVWGEDSYSSYAYPAGGNAAQLTTAIVQPTPM